jgi:hypothetical protein
MTVSAETANEHRCANVRADRERYAINELDHYGLALFLCSPESPCHCLRPPAALVVQFTVTLRRSSRSLASAVPSRSRSSAWLRVLLFPAAEPPADAPLIDVFY